MCTNIVESCAVEGSGKGPSGWFALSAAHVTYDHPFHAPLEHALNIDFVSEAPGGRVAVELTREAARMLAGSILAALERADAYEAG